MHTFEKEDWNAFTKSKVEALIRNSPSPEIGYLVWTRQSYGEREVYEHIDALKARQVKYLRTGLSWAEWVDADGRAWINWYLREYAKHFDVLPCLSFTPPSLALAPRVNAPPRKAAAYAQFVEEALAELGDCFAAVELWNEWNLDTDWDPKLDPNYERFTAMISLAARVAKSFGKTVVLGGPSKVNESTLHTLARFRERDLPRAIDVLGFHNLRGTWSDHRQPPSLELQARLMRDSWRHDVPVWLTEYGFPVADPEDRFDMEELEMIQVAIFAYMVHTCLLRGVSRAYWYTYKDEVHESLRFVTTGWEDVLQFYFGDTSEDGTPRLLAKILMQGGPVAVLRYAAGQGIMPLVERASLGRMLVQ